MRRWIGALTGALLLLANATRANAQACEPACRDGYVCVSGACMSPCQPACAAGELCGADGECRPLGADGEVSERDERAQDVRRKARRRGLVGVFATAAYVGLLGAAARAESRDAEAEIACNYLDCSDDDLRDLFLPELPLLGAGTILLASIWPLTLRGGVIGARNGYPGHRVFRVLGGILYGLTVFGNIGMTLAMGLMARDRAPTYLYHLSAGLGATALVFGVVDSFVVARQTRIGPGGSGALAFGATALRGGAALTLRGAFQ
ncbi:MAG TPA: hypothetical protein RMH85_07335 [Polyangiaceae bacterium LLY-WYZ-15_(1-7)]|nr:hypothetical protein [Myxococcales bacterium]MAT24878.1 hypothetical protein [Sandaracinus sp.]HJK90550.1 hypothetical protein [Polyangiaceae bacterium LLY-WYZ-15_(1-7)]MBJ73490.1 hypothetical protein [Sandaracinus sp.]HJL00277.1 hypothetical protein [Polyangiaceae bacterium LLY-WYZ-15_(1-7)]